MTIYIVLSRNDRPHLSHTDAYDDTTRSVVICIHHRTFYIATKLTRLSVNGIGMRALVRRLHSSRGLGRCEFRWVAQSSFSTKGNHKNFSSASPEFKSNTVVQYTRILDQENAKIINNRKKVKGFNLFGPREHNWWTGKSPSHCPGAINGKMHSLPQLRLDKKCTKESIQAYFDNTWTITETLFSSLQVSFSI